MGGRAVVWSVLTIPVGAFGRASTPLIFAARAYFVRTSLAVPCKGMRQRALGLCRTALTVHRETEQGR